METLLAFFDFSSEHSSGDTRKIKEQKTSINVFPSGRVLKSGPQMHGVGHLVKKIDQRNFIFQFART